MKHKAQKMQVLQERLPKFASQIGIINCEIPTLFFDYAEFCKSVNESSIRLGFKPRGGKTTRSRNWGYCSYLTRGIFISVNVRNRPLRDLEHTLIHELVHYRWHYMSHGANFEKRIKQVKQGKEFKRKHIQYPQICPMK